ncbi:heme ABC transporter ATP-binding protein [Brevibacterium sp. 91QC2O2]|uniref:heme ABC transporter ATP-binding protein n=1 Tax=Brevibacterium sp. 91QC2O2 TaxID=2968458 RepID=UPI00211BA414|nr:heme ABC transporter ATP-binding protein [Brevibacterium sp. 91QC2O2]MCQ9367685.1 heme ABC transporter ATP-binding protein [Brevibacterium sp. 91QC2O2]
MSPSAEPRRTRELHPIRAQSLGFTVGSSALLSDISFTVEEPSLIAVVGPNGAGKSTLLNVLAGNLRPSAGELLIGPHAPHDWNAGELARVRAVMEQEQHPTFGFTVRELVELGRLPHPKSAADDAIVAEAMARAQVTHLADRDVTTLSGGEMARTAFARTLAQGTSIYLLDEPTAALDLKHQEDVMRAAKDLAHSGAIVVAIVHDLGQAARHADRILMLAGGHLTGDGTPEEVLTAQRIEQLYGHPVEVFRSPDSGQLVIVPK